jgi:ATP-dependent DNA helicase RecG
MLAPRNHGNEPCSAIVSRSGGRRTPRRVGTGCHDMTTLAEQLAWVRERQAHDWSATPSGLSPAEARPGAIDALRDYLHESGEPDRIALADEAPDDDLLRRLQLLRPDGGLTRGGALLLCPGEEPRLLYLHREAPGTPADSRVATAGRGLAEELRRIEDSIAARNRTFTLAGAGLARGAVSAIAASSIREALINAVMHRDWDSAGPITVEHVGDELVVFSPGGLFGGVTLRTLLTAPSQTRNRALGNTLRSLRLAEREGTGVDRMYVDQVRLGHAPPVFEERDGGLRVTLIGGEPVDEVLRANTALDRSLRDTARAAVAIDMLRKQPSISAGEFADAAQESEPQALSFLDDAARHGMLKSTASPRPGGIRAWRLADDLRMLLGPVLPYFSRPTGESILLIEQLARARGIVRNQDAQDLLGVRANRASQLLAQALADGRLALAAGAKPVGRGTAYVPAHAPEFAEKAAARLGVIPTPRSQ